MLEILIGRQQPMRIAQIHRTFIGKAFQRTLLHSQKRKIEKWLKNIMNLRTYSRTHRRL